MILRLFQEKTNIVWTIDKYNHLGIILDSKFSSSAHIRAAINKSRKAIGMLKFMSKYLPRNTLNELYKLLRMGLCKLNFHKFKHNFKDTINPMCPVNDGIEDTEHFLLLCNSFREQRCSLLAGVNDVL